MSNPRPTTAQPSEAQEKLIRDLGGPTKVAKIVEQRIGVKIGPSTVSMWIARGIPYRYRGALALEAGEKDVNVPADFLLGAQPSDAA